MPKTGEIVTLAGTRHVVMECGTCGVLHTIPESKYNSCHAEGGFWTCPNGHSRGWEKGADQSEMAQLRRERDRLKQQIAQKDDELRSAEASRRAAVGQVTKMRNRVKNGVCPCCNRTFSNLARHMTSKHPEFKAEPTPDEATIQ